MEIIEPNLIPLMEGQEVVPADFLGTSLSGWAGLKDKTAVYLKDAAREIVIRQALKDLAAPLAAARLHPLVLGGVSLWAREYPEVGMRRVFDLDLWIDPTEFDAFAQIMKEQGFVQSETYQMLWHRGAVEIDLHCHPINDARGHAYEALFQFDQKEIWNRGDPLPCCPQDPWRRPNAEDLWIQLGLHAVKHEFERINLAIDLHLLLQAHVPQTLLGRLLWKEVSPVLASLGFQTKLSSEKPTPLARQLTRPKPSCLTGLRILSSLGERPAMFWWRFIKGNRGTRRESGVLARAARVFKRYRT